MGRGGIIEAVKVLCLFVSSSFHFIHASYNGTDLLLEVGYHDEGVELMSSATERRSAILGKLSGAGV